MKGLKFSITHIWFLVSILCVLCTGIPAVYADGDGDGIEPPFDCNDADPTIYPGAPELCDGLDNDCNYRVPSNEADTDGDGYRRCANDCNDYDASINPGAVEGPNGDPTCSDNKDNDCDTFIDLNDPDCGADFCIDNDGDGYGSNDHASCPNAGTDCNDADANTYPGAPEICDGLDNDCDTVVPADEVDSDGDGFALCDGDCDDTDGNTYPGAAELCDGLDNDCDTVIPANETDGDSDTYRICDGDCDDADPLVNPGVAEGPFGDATCGDTVDNDCDGATDVSDSGCFEPCIDNDGDGYGSNGVAACANGTAIDCDDTNGAVNPGATEGPQGDATCGDGADNDCDGSVDALDSGCGSPCADTDGDGYGTNFDPSCPNPGFDCDDNNPATYPGATEICDGEDNDCNYRVPSDESDTDGDGYRRCANDCNDYDGAINPGAVEGPNGDPTCSDNKDNDCDTFIDLNDPDCGADFCIDNDGDGYGSNDHASCPNAGADCNDADANTYPGATELCDGLDNDCDTVIPADEADADGDGFALCDGDCDDTDGNTYPGAAELCDGLDNDCDTVVPANEADGDTDGYRICDGDCNDGNAAINPGVTEEPFGGPLCNDALDNDCDGFSDATDSGCQEICNDNDGDGYGTNGVSTCPNGTAIDCDDTNAAVNPGATEGPQGDATCGDGLDNDCDGSTDAADSACGSPCADADGDGYGTNFDPSCQNPGFDCDDTNANTYPGAPEICDGLDNDCNYKVPSNESDTDGDGYRRCGNDCNDYDAAINPGAVEGPNGDPTCSDNLDNDCDTFVDLNDPDCGADFCIDNDADGYGANDHPSCPNAGTDCNDADANTYPGAPELCDGLDNNCDTVIPADEADGDGDGFAICQGDCDDTDASTYPGAVELCDGLDNNCDTVVPANESDLDGDGYRACEECDDTDPLVNPGASEGPFGDVTCGDGVDNDCDGATDSADSDCLELCIDNDGDGYGTNGVAACPNGTAIDCDDTNAAVNPGASEGPQGDPTCVDGADNDCDGLVDDLDPACGSPCADGDGDGYGTNFDPSCPNAGFDCDDTNAATYPGAPEICDGEDNDCNYRTPSNEVDTDGDGYRRCANDCNDFDPTVNPGRVEVCSDGIDNNCDTLVDDATCVCPDEDGDGYTLIVCGGTDCDDTNAAVNPGAVEIPFNGLDDDCDPVTLDEPPVDNDGDGSFSDVDCDDNNAARYPGAFEICDDGIDNDCDNQIDLADTYDCGPPVCGTTTLPRNGPHMETLLNPDDTVHPDEGTLRCGKCHYTDAGGGVVPGGEYHCQRCHADPNDTSDPLNGVMKVQYPDPWPYGFGSAQNVFSHSSTIVGTQYGNWDIGCTVCHNPHSQEQNNKYRTSYGKLIKRFICYDNQATGQSILETIEFTSDTGPGSFADGPPYIENICNTCHTLTNHQQRDGTAPDGQDHNNELDCMDCHAHGDGFAPGGEPAAPHNTTDFLNNCDYCHASPTDFTSPVTDSKCEQCHTPSGVLKGGFPAAPDVLTHSDVNGSGSYTYTNGCVDCHQLMGNPTNIKLVRSTLPGSIVPGSNILFTARSGADSFADGPPYEENVCDTCHSMTNHHQSDGTAPGVQTHRDSEDCATCHSHGNAFLPDLVPPPAPHDTADCTACHVTPDTYVPDAAIPSSACLSCHDPASPNAGAGGADTKVASHFPTQDCVECHNPMSVQTNFRGNTNLAFIRTVVNGNSIAFEAKTGPYSFADDTNIPADMTTVNYLCNTCHTATNHHQAGGTAPGGQSHNDGADCTQCHTHLGSFTDHEANTPVPAPHDATACTACHVSPDSYVTNAAIPSSACLSCHDASAPDAATGGADTKVASHFAGMDCVECHNPMSIQTNFRGNTNLAFVRSTVRGSPVAFEAKTGPYSFADDTNTPPDMATQNYICNTCHTLTNHHQADGTAPGMQSHNDGADCTQCHTHMGAFKDHLLSVTVPAPHNSQACTTCHVNPDTYVPDAAIPNSACSSCHASGAPGTAAGGSDTKVASHFPTTDCVECHNPMSIQTNFRGNTNLAFVRSVVNGSNIAFESTTGDYSFGADADAVPDMNWENYICNTCHTATNHHQSGGTAPGGQSHQDGADCTQCHTHLGEFRDQLTNANVPAPHDAQDCTTCHVTPNTYVPNAAIPNSACESCHDAAAPSTGAGGSDTKVASHFPTTDCVECHNPMSIQTNFRGNTNLAFVRTVVNGNNIAFEAAAGPYSFADDTNMPLDMTTQNYICNTCHTATNHHQAGGTAPGGQSHQDGADCTQCHTHLGSFTDQLNSVNVPAPHDTADCTACHVTPDTYVVNADIPNSACGSCHDTGTPDTASGGADTKVIEHYSDNYIDPTTGQLSSLKCVECHNPMSLQVNFRNNTNLAFIRNTIRGNMVAFEARTGPYSFADDTNIPPDMATENYVCNTCHTQTNHHQADGTAPDGQSHNDGDDCSTCHAHNDGFLVTAAAPIPHNTFDCTVCHVTPDTYVPDAAIPNTACLGCHDPGAPGTGSGGSDIKVDTHFSTTYTDPATGQLMDQNCVECHNPMAVQTNFRGNTNLSFIRSDVRGTPVAFEARTGPYSFADDAHIPADMQIQNYICNTCHTQTKHHQNDGTAPDGQSHQDGNDCTGCHTHDGGFQPVGGNNCLVCHNQSPPVGSSDPNRRQIVEGTPGDGSGDFVRTSHHVTDGTATQIVTPDDCLVCHDQTQHTTFGDGVSALLNDADGGASFTYNGNPLTAENFCVNCHDGNHPTPFPSDANSPANIEAGWTASSHKTSGSATCLDCHAQAHGSDFEKILAQANDETLCIGCHDSDGPASMNIQAELSKTSSHNANLCKECHNPHNATAVNPIAGVSGVDPSTPGAGQTPSYTLVTVNNADEQYKLCFTCHTSWNPGGLPTGTTDQGIEFNTNNDSYHWVENDKGTPQIYNGATFNSTWVGKMMPRYDGASNATLRSAQMRCSDCHGAEDSDGGVSVPEGPHGSTRSPILKTPAGSPYTQWNSSVNYASNSGSIWCFNCHSSNFSGTGFARSGARSLHTDKHDDRNCQQCHLAVPHGSGGEGVGSSNQRKRLLNPNTFTDGVDSLNSGSYSEGSGHNTVIPGCT